MDNSTSNGRTSKMSLECQRAGVSGLKRSRRALGEIDMDNDFPPCAIFQSSTKLHTTKSLIGMMRNLTLGRKYNMSTKYVAREVAKEVYSKYFHDSVYCHSLKPNVRRALF